MKRKPRGSPWKIGGVVGLKKRNRLRRQRQSRYPLVSPLVGISDETFSRISQIVYKGAPDALRA